MRHPSRNPHVGKGFLPLLLVLLVVASPVLGRPAELATIDQETLRLDNVPAAVDRVSELYLFAADGPGAPGQPGTNSTGYDFEGLEPAGWTPIPLPGDPYWHVEDVGVVAGHALDMSGAMPFDAGDPENSYALWCGTNTDPSYASEGYGNGWNVTVEIDVNMAFSTGVSIHFSRAAHYEGYPYDYSTIEAANVNGVWIDVSHNHDGGPQPLGSFATVPVTPAELDGYISKFRFHFRSDIAWSDEDGSYVTDIGALWLDNIRVEVDGVFVLEEDFEDGLMPASFHPVATSVYNPENFTILHDGISAPDPCWDDTHDAWGFFDSDTVEPNYPDGVIAYGPPWAWMGLESPTLEVDQNGAPLAYVYAEEESLQLNIDAYVDLPGNALIYYQYSVSARSEATGLFGNWQVYEYLIYGEDLCKTPLSLDIRSLALASSGPGTMTGLKVRIELVDMCPLWCDSQGSGMPHTLGMLIDGVSIGTQIPSPPSELMPVAVFDALPNPVVEDETVGFDASGSYHTDPAQSIVTYEWEFGDGVVHSDSSPLVDHIYADPGTYPAKLRVVDDSVPVRLDSMELEIVVEESSTSVPETPSRFRLHQNVPNPFNPSTKLRFELATAGEVSLAVYDVEGRKLRDLVEGFREAGMHEVTWDGRSGSGRIAPSGVYFARLRARGFVEDRRMVLLK